MFYYFDSEGGTLTILKRSNFQILKTFSMNLSFFSFYKQDLQKRSLLVFFDHSQLYEIDIDLGKVLVDTTFSDFQMLYHSNINFPNKLITGRSRNDDLLFINYYTSKMELNFTNCTTSLGISYDRNIDLVADLIIKKNMREFYILTTTYRLFSFYVYDRINNNDAIIF